MPPVLLPVLLPSSGDDGCAARTTNVDPPEVLSAVISSPMSAKRSSGFFESILRTMASIAGETLAFWVDGAAGATLRCMLTSSPKPSETNGGWPQSISKKMIPSE